MGLQIDLVKFLIQIHIFKNGNFVEIGFRSLKHTEKAARVILT